MDFSGWLFIAVPEARGDIVKRFARIALAALAITLLDAPLVPADLPLEFKGIRIGKRVTGADPLVMGRPDARVSCGSLREGGATICSDDDGWMIGDVAISVVFRGSRRAERHREGARLRVGRSN